MSSQSTKFQLKLKKVIYITFAWLCLNLFQVFYDYLIVISYTNNPELFRLPAVLVTTIFIAIIAGILGGTFIVNKVEPWLKSLPFWKALVLLLGFYTITGLVLMTLGSFVFQSIVLDVSIFDALVVKEVKNFLTGLDFLKLFISWGLIFLGTIVLLMIYDKYGPGNFRNLLLGRYFHPRTEERIFMFVDMKASTTIAEQIGNIKFHSLLNDFFRDLTDPVLFTEGEVYQYVGDEIIVSWTMKHGLHDFNCVRCFYAMQEAIMAQKAFYQEKYGLVPEFKAGLHCGQVTTGEIGVIKRDIAYLGDVLNTTARIQAKCNNFDVDILLSKHLLDMLNIPPQSLNQKKIGDIDLRGRIQKVILYTLEEFHHQLSLDADFESSQKIYDRLLIEL